MVRKKDKFWVHVEQLGLNRFKCKYCELDFSGSVTRVKAHLACLTGHDVQICSKVPDHIQVEALAELNLNASKKRKSETMESGIGSTTDQYKTTVLEIASEKDKSLDRMLTDFFVKNNISFNLIEIDSFINMMRAACEYGPGFVVPDYSTLRTRLIPEAKIEVMEYVSNIKSTWATTGCTIMSDSWTDLKKRSWVNVIAYSTGGVVFLKCIDCGTSKITAPFLFKEISAVIEELGPQNVVQFISDNTANYNFCGDMLRGKWHHIYTTNCAAHGVNLLLKDIYKHVNWVREVINDGKNVVDYMLKHTAIFALMKQFINDKELKQPSKTRFATYFSMLQSLVAVENELRLLVASSDWSDFHFNEAEMAVKIARIIQSDAFWEGAKEVVSFMEPIILILRLVDSEGATTGYLFEATERAKETLQKFVEKDGVKYSIIMALLNSRLKENIIHHVHVLAAILNPAFMYAGRFKIETSRILEAQDFILETMLPPEEHDQFTAEMVEYRMKNPKVFSITGMSMMRVSHPRIWWQFCGGCFPVVQKVACKILCQPCSSSHCERNWSAWDAAQTKKRNRLVPDMIEDLVYIRMNSLMKEKYDNRELQDLKPIDLEKLSDLLEEDIELEMERLEQTYVESDPPDNGIDGMDLTGSASDSFLQS
ncbi:uncharacterized protein LOC122076517 [Macadamia integrifolia]|uniref:uncharacterized protein LOC122076517 n=1 Tax=Macadamia integrifolia TaxID=60698 RepID=UPI001C50045B|nr:uncharacterized protein LOC122076517 [Macadamia integrifolia]